MEWFVLSSPVPAAVDFSFVAAGLVAVGFLAAVVPVLIAARAALVVRRDAIVTPQLRLVEGGSELSQRAA